VRYGGGGGRAATAGPRGLGRRDGANDLAEELIEALAQLEGLRVVARTSAFQFGGKGHDLREVGEKLKVATVIEGSVRKAGNRLHIKAQLIKVEDGYHLWSKRYDREMDDIFAVQDEIARAVVNELKVKLLGASERPLVTQRTENLEAGVFARGALRLLLDLPPRRTVHTFV